MTAESHRLVPKTPTPTRMNACWRDPLEKEVGEILENPATGDGTHLQSPLAPKQRLHDLRPATPSRD